MPSKCPKCGAPITAIPDALGFVACPKCNVRLRVAVAPAPPPAPNDLAALLGEVRALSRMQGELLQLQVQTLNLLKGLATAGRDAEPSCGASSRSDDNLAAPETEDEPPAPPSVPRVRQRRKAILVVDDDEASIRAILPALEQAQIPTRTVRDGNSALAAMAESKPDVLVLELAIGEPMPGKDLINYIKSTMEWVDTPIVLYTRLPVASQHEARTVHGADEVVLKGPGSPESLLNRVIYLFQHR
jgi:CheY-like chemotaxis protein